MSYKNQLLSIYPLPNINKAKNASPNVHENIESTNEYTKALEMIDLIMEDCDLINYILLDKKELVKNIFSSFFTSDFLNNTTEYIKNYLMNKNKNNIEKNNLFVFYLFQQIFMSIDLTDEFIGKIFEISIPFDDRKPFLPKLAYLKTIKKIKELKKLKNIYYLIDQDEKPFNITFFFKSANPSKQLKYTSYLDYINFRLININFEIMTFYDNKVFSNNL